MTMTTRGYPSSDRLVTDLAAPPLDPRIVAPQTSVTMHTDAPAGQASEARVPAPASLPSACPVCGAYSLAPDAQASALLAVCDVLTVKALETMGKWIVRQSRERYRTLGTRPYHLAHTLWQPDEATVSKALRSAWDVVPAMLDTHGCCDITSIQVTRMLDSYVHDLAVTGTAHTLAELHYRFVSRLGLPVYHRDVHGGRA